MISWRGRATSWRGEPAKETAKPRKRAESEGRASFFLLLILFLPVSSCPLLGRVLTRETRHRPSLTTVTSPIRFRWLHFHLGFTYEIIICFPPPPFFTGRFHVFFYIFSQFSVAYEHSYGSYRAGGVRGGGAVARRPRPARAVGLVPDQSQSPIDRQLLAPLLNSFER